jgi:hypothetical protein
MTVPKFQDSVKLRFIHLLHAVIWLKWMPVSCWGGMGVNPMTKYSTRRRDMQGREYAYTLLELISYLRICSSLYSKQFTFKKNQHRHLDQIPVVLGADSTTSRTSDLHALHAGQGISHPVSHYAIKSKAIRRYRSIVPSLLAYSRSPVQDPICDRSRGMKRLRRILTGSLPSRSLPSPRLHTAIKQLLATPSELPSS